MAAPVPAARGSAACPGEAGPCWSRSSPSPSPAVRVLWCCRAAPPDISCKRGLVFFQNTVYYRFHNQFLLGLCGSPCGTPWTCAAGRGKWGSSRGCPGPHLSSLARKEGCWLLCKLPQVAIIFLKDLSVAAVSSLANSPITQHQQKHVCLGFQAALSRLSPQLSSLPHYSLLFILAKKVGFLKVPLAQLFWVQFHPSLVTPSRGVPPARGAAVGRTLIARRCSSFTSAKVAFRARSHFCVNLGAWMDTCAEGLVQTKRGAGRFLGRRLEYEAAMVECCSLQSHPWF